jgi:hypothetical protein
MPATVTVRDETPAGDVTDEWSLEFLSETVSVRDLIRERVYQEVQDYNVRKRASPFRGLVQPEAHEVALNGSAKAQPIDWRKQFEKATEAFETHRMLILVDDRQAESLDQTLTIGTDTTVTFLRLTLLVGG